MFGGIKQSGSTNDLFLFNTDQNLLEEVKETKGTKPSKRWLHGSAVVNASLFVFGGYDTNYNYVNDLYELKIGDLEWIQIKYQCLDHLGNVNMKGISPRKGMSFFEFENRLHLFGGEYGIALNDYHSYNPKTKIWSQAFFTN